MMAVAAKPSALMDNIPRITVIGVGGAGCNAVDNMVASGLHGVHFVVANTDAQSLASSTASHKIQLGAALTDGLGAGSKPEIGAAAAEEALDEIRTHIAGSHMLFIAAGMGGGTGTGAAAVVARVARELDILTVAIVTRPFHFEGQRRQRIADTGIGELARHVDTMIVIPNQNLFRIATERTTFAEAFRLADDVLHSGIACIVDLIIREGLINLDFADVQTVLAGMGTAMMGRGEASGPRRAIEAAEEAISNPLLDDVSLRGACGLLVSISGGRDMTLYEIDEAASRIRSEVDPEANIIVGATIDDSVGDFMRVSIVASGMARTSDLARATLPPPVPGRPSQAHAGSQGSPPPPPTAPYAETPVAGGPRAAAIDAEMARRLIDSLSAPASDSDAPAYPPPPPVAPAHSPAASPASNTIALRPAPWTGPGDVTIEERPPLAVATSAAGVAREPVRTVRTAPPRRPGLLDRITGRARGEADSAPDQPTPTHSGDHERSERTGPPTRPPNDRTPAPPSADPADDGQDIDYPNVLKMERR